MLKVGELIEAQEAWDDVLELSYDLRQKSRLRVGSLSGFEYGIQLPRGTVLQDGQLLRAEDGRIIKIQAECEALTEVSAPDGFQLARLCYHLGNRHVALQITAGSVRYLQDNVMDQMLMQMGFELKHISAGFFPEPGAFNHHA